mgnify:CR=1 FL=1|jgi:hypothetical protein
MSDPVVDEKPLSSIEWTILCVLNQEITDLKVKPKPSNQEQVVIDWLQERLDRLNARRHKN